MLNKPPHAHPSKTNTLSPITTVEQNKITSQDGYWDESWCNQSQLLILPEVFKQKSFQLCIISSTQDLQPLLSSCEHGITCPHRTNNCYNRSPLFAKTSQTTTPTLPFPTHQAGWSRPASGWHVKDLTQMPLSRKYRLFSCPTRHFHGMSWSLSHGQ